MGAEGFTSQSMQQGGIGLLMTVLIVSSPPLAAMFFQGTVGNFLTYSAFGAGGHSLLGPQGQPPGSYGGSGYVRASAGTEQPAFARPPGEVHNQGPATRLPGTSRPHADTIRLVPAPTFNRGSP
jgi:type IV secretion system protein VirB6